MITESDTLQDREVTSTLPEQTSNPSKSPQNTNQLEITSLGLLLSTQNGPQLTLQLPDSNPEHPPNQGPPYLNETTPLLTNEIQHESPSLLYYRLRIFLYISIVSIVIFPVIYHLVKDLSDIDKDAVKSVTTTLNSVSFLGFNNEGIKSRASGSLHIDYSVADRPFHHYLLRFGAFLAGGSLIIRPTSPVQISLRHSDVEKFTKFANVLAPPMEVSILQNSTTLFTLDTNSSLDSLASAWLGKYLFVDEAVFVVHAQFTADFQTKFLTVKNRPIDIITTTTWKPGQPSFKIDQVKLEQAEKAIQLLAVADVETFKLPLNLTLGDVLSLVSLLDCLGHKIEIGQVLSKDVSLKPDVPLRLNLTGKIGPIDKDLVRDCSKSGSEFTQDTLSSRLKGSPISQLVRSYLAGENIQVHLQILNILLLPFWLTHWISSVSVPLSLHIPVPEFQGPIASNISIIEMDLQVDDSVIYVNSNVSLWLDAKHYLLQDVEVLSLGGDFEIFNENDLILSGKTIQPAIASGIQNLNLSLQLEVKIGDLEVLGNILGQLLRNDTIETTIKLSQAFVEVNLPIYLGKLDKLNFDHNVNFNLPSSSAGLLYDINIQVESISVVKSTKELITVDVEVQFQETFLPLLLEIPFDLISYEIKYSGQKVANFKITNLLEISSEFKFVATVTAFKTAANEIEDLISKYVSGFKGLQIDIVNGDVIIPRNPNFSAVLLEIELYNFTIPEISYSRGNSIDNNLLMDKIMENSEPSDLTIESSPFLVEATIFLLTSEVQLKIFNPIVNRDISGVLNLAIAKYEGKILGTIGRAEMTISPGLYVLPRIPFVTNKGIGGDILRKALNNKLDIEITALFEVEVIGEQFGWLSLMYQGRGVLTSIKL